MIRQRTGGAGGVAQYPYNVTGLSATSRDNAATIGWVNPTDPSWVQTVLVRRTDRYPTSDKDGTQVAVTTAPGAATVQDEGLPEGPVFYCAVTFGPRRAINATEANRARVDITYVYPSPLLAFTVTATDERAVINFTLPLDATGVRIVYKPGSFPATITDGTVIDSATNGMTVTGLVNGSQYFFRAFPFNAYGRFNQVAAGNQATATPREIIPSPVTDFALAAGNAEITATLTKPDDATGVRLVVKAGSAPTNIDDGTVIPSAASGQVITGLINGTIYYVRAFPYNQYNRFNTTEAGQIASATPVALRIWGVMRDMTNSSTKLTRTDAAANYPDPVAAVGTGAGSSPFDGLAPWNFKVCNVVNNVVTAYEGDPGFSFVTSDVMVEVPLFYYRRWQSGNDEGHQIADGPAAGFLPSPAHDRPDGLRNYIYIPRYQTGGAQNVQVSRSGIAPLVSLTRALFRTGARSKGVQWSQWDIATWMSLSMLLLVEWADYDSQMRIGQGVVNAGNAVASGGTDLMRYHTGRIAGVYDAVSVQWRGIENLWGNVRQWLDGINVNNLQPYINKNPATFSDDTITGYTPLGYTSSGSEGYIIRHGVDANNPWVAIPSAVGGSESTHIPDRYYLTSGWAVVNVGGHWIDGAGAGFWYWRAFNSASGSSTSVGSRLLFIP